MPMQQPTQPFRFLDLPGEIRNKIYGSLLCTWEHEVEPDHDSHGLFSRRFPEHPTAAILRVSKQVHSEAHDYMIKKNQFVRITCRDLDLHKLFLQDVSVVSSNARRISQFQGYAMHITLSKPVPSSTAPNPFDFELMILRADLSDFCQKLDVESAMADVNCTASAHTSLRAEIKLSQTDTYTRIPSIQEHLLYPIATFVRGISNLSIQDPVDPAVAQTAVNEAAKRRWIDPDATLGDIITGVDVGKRHWEQNSYHMASATWSHALHTLDRVRHSSSWLALKETGGMDFVNSTAELYFTLNLLLAQYIQDQADPITVRHSGLSLTQCLQRCKTASARFAFHAASTWAPSNRQRAEMLYRDARCIRVNYNARYGTKALLIIEEALELDPNDAAFQREKENILVWNSAVRVEAETTARTLETAQQQSAAGTIWLSVRTFFSELAA